MTRTSWVVAERTDLKKKKKKKKAKQMKQQKFAAGKISMVDFGG